MPPLGRGPTERCIEAHERAFRTYLESGDRRSAARLALALVRDHALANAGSVAAGWAKRAERLLEEEDECPEQGYLARQRAATAHARGDSDEARHHLRRALEIAQKFGDRDLEAMTLHLQGNLLVRDGEIDDGWALIDEAAAAAAAGDLRPTATGTVYCGTISACRDLLEVRRASEWTTQFEQWCERASLPGGWRGDCRVHRAEVLRIQGRWAEAEEAAESAANDFLEYNMPGEAGQAAYELGEVRLRRGVSLGRPSRSVASSRPGESRNPASRYSGSPRGSRASVSGSSSARSPTCREITSSARGCSRLSSSSPSAPRSSRQRAPPPVSSPRSPHSSARRRSRPRRPGRVGSSWSPTASVAPRCRRCGMPSGAGIARRAVRGRDVAHGAGRGLPGDSRQRRGRGRARGGAVDL